MSWLAALGALRRALDERPAAEIAADVRAEIEHHLECAARARVEAGETPEEARAQALARFGDVSRVERECLWAHTGGRIVLQRIHMAVTVLLLAAVILLAWRGRQASAEARRAAEQAELTARAAFDVENRAIDAELRARGVLPLVDEVVIGVGDELEITDEYNASEIGGKQLVAADGKVLLPEVGWLSVAGLTREQAEEALNNALAPYFVQTKVRVRVTKVTNLGKVRQIRGG